MRAALASVFVLALASNVFGETWFKGSLDDALAAAKRQQKLVLVDFTQDG